MSALLAGGPLETLSGEAAVEALAGLRTELLADRLVPYLGPELLALEGKPSVPASPEEIAAALQKRVPVPGRIRGNMWAVAQYIESRRHRRTLKKLMAEVFAGEPRPSAFHRFLAQLSLSLVVDSWYDGTLAAAMVEAGRDDVADLQGMSRAAIGEDRWYNAFDLTGSVTEPSATGTLLYRPHGGIQPVGDVLVSDSDYVEALTEIDIQTPIPEAVRERRATRGFLFLGCRFHDQMLRTYARQIIKRSAGPHACVADAATLTSNEQRFLAAGNIVLIDMPLVEAVRHLAG
ncbi:SIR2 family protein [Pleomorphomonas koreensis]|uniref:SIR2 family protein n=1 Tax=Pleomorphomonas koreensis TaxID=257440 RepID=UPI0003F5709F|nr:SIR2 family protein [Pleomorphomonas koreensis]